MKNVKVIGIDPAPSNPSTVFDGSCFHQFSYLELQDYLAVFSEEQVLICWDAPLSFCIKPNETPFTKRIIEKFFSRKDGIKTEKGISVQMYASCSHWTISQYILGYPQIGSIKNINENDLKLVFKKPIEKKSVTEVHPAVAIWVWCKENYSSKNWNYKNDTKVFNTILKTLIQLEVVSKEIAAIIMSKKDKEKDDYLDAYIAWKLGKEWLSINGTVEILGNETTGSFLLPYNENIFDAFNKFINQNYQ